MAWPEVAAAISTASRVPCALGPLLPLALEVEERVVDADGHPDQHDHAADRGFGRAPGGQRCGDADGGGHAGDGEQHRDAGGDRARRTRAASAPASPGRLNLSADDRSSATRSSMLSSMVMSPAWRISRPGCSSWTPLGRPRPAARRRRGPWRAGSRRAAPSGRGSTAAPTPRRHRRGPPAGRPDRSAAEPRPPAGRAPVAAGGDQDVLGVGASRPAVVHHRVGAAGLAEAVVRVGRLLGGDRRSPGRPPRGRRRARRGWRATGGWRSSGRPGAGRRRVGSGRTWRCSWVVRTRCGLRVSSLASGRSAGQGRQVPDGGGPSTTVRGPRDRRGCGP